ncbi:hypothetical protein [Streptacidiphilus sp. EB103A]|uniref:hypothetical protein n=1 Tax=Streptacidiphilus sp. EB103A TaxID=3156275 RepID=UPI00351719EA
MPQRNRKVQRAARQLDDLQGLSYTDARGVARRGNRITRLAPARAMLDAGTWSRYGRWLHPGADWDQWRVRCGSCGRVQGPDLAREAGLALAPELAFTECLSRLHPDAEYLSRLLTVSETRVCPAAVDIGDYYRVFSRTGCSRVLMFAGAGDFLEYPAPTAADDEVELVPGVTLLSTASSSR